MSARIDLTGKKFGRWTVLRFTGQRLHSSALWTCRCSCGTETTVLANSLLRGKSTNCGCQRVASLIAKQTEHGEARRGRESAEYQTWKGLKGRCLNPNDVDYSQYGGRGIKVCDRWLNYFEAFLEDMGRRPLGMTIDREDPDGDYTPSNCRWSSYKVQVENRRPFKQDVRRGENSNLAKLSAADVISIRELRGAASQRQIATRYGVTQGCISQIFRGKTWANIQTASLSLPMAASRSGCAGDGEGAAAPSPELTL